MQSLKGLVQVWELLGGPDWLQVGRGPVPCPSDQGQSTPPSTNDLACQSVDICPSRDAYPQSGSPVVPDYPRTDCVGGLLHNKVPECRTGHEA